MVDYISCAPNAGAKTLHRGSVAYEYTNYSEEILGCKESAMLGTGLNFCSPTYEITGSQIREFMTSICTNSFMKLEAGSIRHAIMCDEKGRILTDGVVMCTAEDTFRTYWLSPVLQYYLEENTRYDVHGRNLTGQEFFFQISGPKSLEIMENAFKCDFHDIGFAQHRLQQVEDYEIRVLRLGMSGNLGYEIHGEIKDMDCVYNKLLEAGKPYGMKRLGQLAYGLSHTEAGFPNINIHYPLPWYEHEGIAAYLERHPEEGLANYQRILKGSVGDNLDIRFVTPYDVGWGNLVRFDHDYPGRDALEKIKNNVTRTVTTLEWNPEDIAAIYAAQFRGREESLNCERIDSNPVDFYMTNEYRADYVLLDNQIVGISSGRICSYWYKKMISLAFINPEYANEGTELTLLWGTPGCKQFKVRVKVARYPYNAEFGRNQTIDVSEIPHVK